MSFRDLFNSGSRNVKESQLNRVLGENLNSPASSWRFIVRWPEIPGVNNFMTGPHYVVAETISFTHPSVPSQGRHNTGTMTYFPDFNDIEGTSITLYEDENYSALYYFMKWRNLMLDSSGNYFPASNYKRNITVEAYSFRRSNIPVFTGTLIGVWPSEISTFEYSYEDSERIKLEVQLSVDSNEVNFLGIEESTSQNRLALDASGRTSLAESLNALIG